MSSARQPPRPSRERSQSQRTPSRWYGRSAVRSASPGSAWASRAGPRAPRSSARVSASHAPAWMPAHSRSASASGFPSARSAPATSRIASMNERRFPELRLGDLLVAEGEADGEVEQRVEAERGGLSLSNGDGHAWPRGPAAAPPVGHSDDDAALLERRHLAEEAVGLGW